MQVTSPKMTRAERWLIHKTKMAARKARDLTRFVRKEPVFANVSANHPDANLTPAEHAKNKS